jgi:AraC family transcriptional regulator of adaptative response / DNA-3-methyladenine glycosylase II
MAQTVVIVPCVEPFDWSGILDFLRPRAIPGVEWVSGDRYSRLTAEGRLVVERAPGGLRAQTERPCSHLARRIAEMFDVDARARQARAVLSRDLVMRAWTRRWPGLRIPGAWDWFELAVRAILGQQVSVAAATTLSGRLAAKFGLSPEVMAEADVQSIGLPAQRAEAIRGLARAVAEGLRPRHPDELLALPGIGPWTAQYVAMRAFRDPDAFPASDLGLRKAAGGCDAKTLAQRAEAWRPWRSYAAFYLWRHYGSGA